MTREYSRHLGEGWIQNDIFFQMPLDSARRNRELLSWLLSPGGEISSYFDLGFSEAVEKGMELKPNTTMYTAATNYSDETVRGPG
jgi:hypothetical protein